MSRIDVAASPSAMANLDTERASFVSRARGVFKKRKALDGKAVDPGYNPPTPNGGNVPRPYPSGAQGDSPTGGTTTGPQPIEATGCTLPPPIVRQAEGEIPTVGGRTESTDLGTFIVKMESDPIRIPVRYQVRGTTYNINPPTLTLMGAQEIEVVPDIVAEPDTINVLPGYKIDDQRSITTKLGGCQLESGPSTGPTPPVPPRPPAPPAPNPEPVPDPDQPAPDPDQPIPTPDGGPGNFAARNAQQQRFLRFLPS